MGLFLLPIVFAWVTYKVECEIKDVCAVTLLGHIIPWSKSQRSHFELFTVLLSPNETAKNVSQDSQLGNREGRNLSPGSHFLSI